MCLRAHQREIGAQSRRRKPVRPSVISTARSSGRLAHDLARAAVRPDDLHRVDGLGPAQADGRRQRVVAEARAAADDAVDRAPAVGPGQAHTHPGADRGAVGPRADQAQRQPAIAVARVLEEDVVRLVAGHGAAGLEEQVQVAVAVPVGERDAVPLLKMPRARGDRHVLEPAAADIVHQDVGHQVGIGRAAGAQVEIEEAVVVDVAEIRAHRQPDPVEAGLPRDVGESASLVVVQPRTFAAGRAAQLAQDDLRRGSPGSR